MALEEDVRILSGVRLFDGFTQEQLRLLAFGGEAMRLPERRVLYREGDEADCAFVIVDGAVESFGDNVIRSNGGNVDGSVTRVGLQ